MKPNNFDKYQKKLDEAKFHASRKNLKPVDLTVSFQKYLDQCITEGNALLAAEAKKDSVKPETKKTFQAAMKKVLDNPYTKAHKEILEKMDAEKRSLIERMERGETPKTHLYDDFAKEVRQLGDQLSNNN